MSEKELLSIVKIHIKPGILMRSRKKGNRFTIVKVNERTPEQWTFDGTTHAGGRSVPFTASVLNLAAEIDKGEIQRLN